jgi:hypothetical protein
VAAHDLLHNGEAHPCPFFNALWRYATIGKNRLLAADVDAMAVKQISGQYSFGPLLYLICLALAWVNVPASLVLNAVLAGFLHSRLLRFGV